MSNTIFGGTTATPTPISTIDQTYNPESENAQSGKAVGKALTNYVKNTDYATHNKSGVVMADAGLGVQCGYASAGKLNIAKATNEEIDAKKQLYKPIVPANLDYAVNSVLKKEYELINTIIVTPDTDGELPINLIIDKDSNGNSFELSSFYVNINGAKSRSSNYGFYATVNDVAIIGNASISLKENQLRKFILSFRKLDDGFMQASVSSSTLTNAYWNAQSPIQSNLLIPPQATGNIKTIKKINMYCFETEWMSGSTFELWGVRK